MYVCMRKYTKLMKKLWTILLLVVFVEVAVANCDGTCATVLLVLMANMPPVDCENIIKSIDPVGTTESSWALIITSLNSTSYVHYNI